MCAMNGGGADVTEAEMSLSKAGRWEEEKKLQHARLPVIVCLSVSVYLYAGVCLFVSLGVSMCVFVSVFFCE